jgi:hypothetical protein
MKQRTEKSLADRLAESRREAPKLAQPPLAAPTHSAEKPRLPLGRDLKKYRPGTREEEESAGNGPEARPARALPKLAAPLARRARIAGWRMFRPLTRWQRRASPLIVLTSYFGILGVLSLSATTYFLMPSRQKAPAAVAPTDIVAMRLGAPSRSKAIQEPPKEPADAARLQSQADEEFRSGNYAAAEQHFRELLPTAHFRALTGFQVFLCLLKQKKAAEAELMAGRFPSGVSARNPSGLYVRAATALTQGRAEDARSVIGSARRQYPLICPLYDKVLAEARLAPEP